MGGCINPSYNTMIDGETDKLDHKLSFKISSCLNEVLSIGLEDQISPSFSDKIVDEFKSVNSDELFKSSCQIRSMAEACLDTRSPKHSIGGKINSRSPSIMSSPSSSCLDFEDALSFDGLNKKVCNRHDIGLSMLKAMISNGADAKVLKTHGDRSCLMFAVLAKDFDFIKKLVQLGVDVNESNKFGETALSFADKFQTDDIAKYLRAQGAVEV